MYIGVIVSISNTASIITLALPKSDNNNNNNNNIKYIYCCIACVYCSYVTYYVHPYCYVIHT